MADDELTANEDVVCICTQPIKQGFRNEGTDSYDSRWWVHVICGKPTEAWLRSIGDEMLNFFRGGPLDGTAYETSTLLAPVREASIPITEYKWTPEVITSEKTGRQARVWVHKALIGTEAAQPAPVSEDAAAPTDAEPAVDPSSDPAAMRKTLKLSRKQVSQMTGLSEAKIARIESGSARTTEEEMNMVLEALESYAQTEGHVVS